jgi:nitrogen fixation protein NifU and related proteins
MSELRELYQQVILDHYKRPRNFQELPDANRKAEGYNPLCGDQITVYLHMDGDVIEDISFQGAGCAISQSAASLMTTTLKGKTRAEAEEIFQKFHDMVTGEQNGGDPMELGKLAVFCGVSEFPVRVKCASLPWHTLRAALEGKDESISTE